jgi:magnesium transporter
VEGKLAMKLRWIDSTGVHNHDLTELTDLRRRADGFLWLDVPHWNDEAEALLSSEFHFHSMAITESRNRNHIPRVHVYPDHLFIVVHAPELGTGGHVHYLELDQFVGEDFVVTVHGPINPRVPLEAALRETEAVAARMAAGRLRPTSPFGLMYAIASSITRRKAEMVGEIAREVGLLEQRVMADVDEDPQRFLSELFAARHQLLTIKTMAEQGSEIYRRATKLTRFAPPEGLERMKDVFDQYETVTHISDSQLRFLVGVTEFYRAHRYQDDHCRRATRGHRGPHPPYYVAVVRHGHERHRQRIHAMATADHPLVDHAGYFVDPVALGPQTRLVVIIRAAPPVRVSNLTYIKPG